MSTTRSFPQLPLDILLEIFRLLSVEDLTHLSQTCWDLRDAVADRAVWVDKESYLKSDYLTSNSTLSVSTEDLRRRVVQETIVDSQWRKTWTKPRKLNEIDRNPDIEFADLLPGGNYIAIFYNDGTVVIRSVSSSQDGPTIQPITCSINSSGFEFICYNIFHVSEGHGRLMLFLDHVDGIVDSDHSQTDCETSFLVDFHVGAGRDVNDFGWSEPIFATLGMEFGSPMLHLSCFQIPSSNTPSPSPLNEAYFVLLDTERQWNLDNYVFVMMSPHRIVVGGTNSCISVYDLPSDFHFSTRHCHDSAVPITPIWKSQDSSFAGSHSFRRSPICYDIRGPQSPVVYFFEDGRFVHILRLSHSKKPIEEHRKIKLEHSRGLAVGFSRGFWCTGLPGVATVSMLSISETMHVGTYDVILGEEMFDISRSFCFDEISGRAAFVVYSRSSCTRVMIVDDP